MAFFKAATDEVSVATLNESADDADSKRGVAKRKIEIRSNGISTESMISISTDQFNSFLNFFYLRK